jgi:hypothetical protein
MLTAGKLAIVVAAAGALAGMPLSKAQACDNDRFPCPIVSEAPSQDSADAAPAAPAQQSKKKPAQAAQQGDKSSSAKGERDTAQAPPRPKPRKRTGQDQANRAAKPGNKSRRTPPAHLPVKQSRSRPPRRLCRSSLITARLSAPIAGR